MKNDTAKEKRLNCWNDSQQCSFSARKGAQEEELILAIYVFPTQEAISWVLSFKMIVDVKKIVFLLEKNAQQQ